MEESISTESSVLIVGDQPEESRVLTSLLARRGYRVEEAAAGPAALEAARRLQPDLILLAAGAEGLEVLVRLKAEEGARDIPVLCIAASGGSQAVARAFAAGAADCLTRPVQREELLARVETHLALRALKRQLADREARLVREIGERERIADALREAEAQGLDLVENLRDVIYTADAEGTLTYISPAIEAFIGYEPQEVTGHHFRDFIYHGDLERLGENLQHILSGQSTSNEYRVMTKAGQVRWTQTSSQPVFEEGRVVGVQGVLTDITDRKLAEERIREQNEFLTMVLEALTHPFYVVDAQDYTVRIANSAARAASVSGAITCYALTHGRSSPCGTDDHPCPLEEVRRTKRPATVEHEHLDGDGNVQNVEVHAYPLFDGEGNVVRIIEYALDVTERKRAEAALRENEENWRSLTEYSPDHIMLLDREARILFINRTFPELSQEQVLDTSFYDYALPEYREETRACFERVLRTGQPDRFESVFVDADGHRVTFESHVGPVRRSGGVWGLVLRSTDITEAKQIQEALETLSHELGERVKELNCLYGISELSRRQDITLEEILQGAVELIPPAWLYPEITSARVILDGKEFKTEGFRETEWRQAGDIVVHGKQIGMLEVCLLEQRPFRDQGPFLVEERNLINAVAERLGIIVERIRAEEALRESEARWRSVTQNSPDHVLLLDADLHIEFANYASPGLTVEELVGTPLYHYVPKERQSEIQGLLENVLRTSEPASYETMYSAPDGSTIYYESRVVPRTVGDRVVGLALNARDISEHKRAEQALLEAKEVAEAARREERERRQEAEQRRQIAESLAEVLAALNSNRPLNEVLGYIATQARRLLHGQAVAIYRLEGEAGTPTLQAAEGLPDGFVPGADVPPGLGALLQALETGQPVAVRDVALAPLHLVADGDGVAPSPSCAALCRALLAVPIVVQEEVLGGILLYYAEPRTLSDDEVTVAAVFADQVALASENARLREQVRQAATDAERSRLARDLHDSVTQALFSATLVAEVLPQVWRRDPGEAEEGLEELRQLTRSALAEMRTLLLELRPTALVETRLGDLLQQLTAALTSRAQVEATCDVEPVPVLPPEVHVTFYRVAQEALNNAVKHAEARQVIVSLRASPPFAGQNALAWRGQVALHVSDDGQGFDPDATGLDQLGLAIMRERAESIGATLDIESQMGAGTQATLVWQSTQA